MKKQKKLKMTGDEMFWYRLFRDNGYLEEKDVKQGKKRKTGKRRGENGQETGGQQKGQEPQDTLGLGAMVGYGFLISIPAIGLVAAIALALRKGRPLRARFAMACIALKTFYMIFAFLFVYAMISVVYRMSVYLAA